MSVYVSCHQVESGGFLSGKISSYIPKFLDVKCIMSSNTSGSMMNIYMRLCYFRVSRTYYSGLDLLDVVLRVTPNMKCCRVHSNLTSTQIRKFVCYIVFLISTQIFFATLFAY